MIVLHCLIVQVLGTWDGNTGLESAYYVLFICIPCMKRTQFEFGLSVCEGTSSHAIGTNCTVIILILMKNYFLS